MTVSLSSGTSGTTFVMHTRRWRELQGYSSSRAHWWAGLRPGKAGRGKRKLQAQLGRLDAMESRLAVLESALQKVVVGGQAEPWSLANRPCRAT